MWHISVANGCYINWVYQLKQQEFLFTDRAGNTNQFHVCQISVIEWFRLLTDGYGPVYGDNNNYGDDIWYYYGHDNGYGDDNGYGKDK